MIQSLEIENFKGIAARQRITFAPLTLLFGANSAGKSTILQALLYLHELIERGSADVDRTELGGSVLELGGFARLVHRHETDRAIVLRVEFATPGGLERFGRDLTDFPFPDFDDEVESAWVELAIRHRTTSTFSGPIVERAVIGVNADATPLVWLELGGSLREGESLQARVNLGHPLIAGAAGEIFDAWQEIGVEVQVGDEHPVPVFFVVRSRLSVLPHPNEPLKVLPFEDLDDLRDEARQLGLKELQSDEVRKRQHEIQQTIQTRERALLQVRTFLEMAVLGTTAQLSAFLKDTLYIGPLRSIPPRGFLYERAGRITSWADGLAAWDLLLRDRWFLSAATNAWLERLKAGCQIVEQELFDRESTAEQLSSGHVDKTVRRILLNTGSMSLVLPSEVGAGISQLIPVVVAAVEERPGLLLVEQPEIHVHPAVQVGLGDLFIEAVSRKHYKKLLLIETHSEHLILRVLRRIRETTDNDLPPDTTRFSRDQLSVLYVQGKADGIQIRRMNIDEHGEFTEPWPKGFFAERAEELF